MAPRRGGRTGVALVTVILLMVVLLVTLKALIVVATGESARTWQFYKRTAALYVVKAAVAEASTQLEARPDWDEGFESREMADGRGTYSIRFNSGPGVQPQESVNNLAGDEWVDGPRGEGTVPPRTADLVVLARFEGLEHRVEVLLSSGPSGSAVPYALTASNRVLLQGDVLVDGVKTLSGPETAASGIHSNRDKKEDVVVEWRPGSPGDRARISGAVSVVSPSAEAIDFGSDPTAYQVEGGFETGAARKPMPSIDIQKEIESNRDHPAPALVPFGTSVLTAGEYSQKGDLSLEGDLVLDGATLFVDGSLEINGSISGQGSVYVKKDTSFQGDSRILTNQESGVALFSHGDVELSGFNGTEYMNALAAGDPEVDRYWGQIQSTVKEMQSLMSANTPTALLNLYNNDLEAMQRVLGDPLGGTWRGRDNDCLGKLIPLLERQPASGARDFLVERLGELRRVFGPASYSHTAILKDWQNQTNNRTGIFEAVLDLKDASSGEGGSGAGVASKQEQILMAQMMQLVDQVDYDRMGTSYFQGVVYTDGSVHAANELNVLGALWANSKEDSGGSGELKPGDIQLDQGTRLTLVEEYVVRLGGTPTAARPQIQGWREL